MGVDADASVANLHNSMIRARRPRLIAIVG